VNLTSLNRRCLLIALVGAILALAAPAAIAAAPPAAIAAALPAAIAAATAAAPPAAIAAAPPAATAAASAASQAADSVPGYLPGTVIVGLTAAPTHRAVANITKRMGARLAATALTSQTRLIRLRKGLSVAAAVKELRAMPGVAYAVPDYIAHTAGAWIPNDPGRGRTAQGWEKLQWNLLPAEGVDAPAAWGNLIADHRAGGKGVVVAILDTGVAYRNWRNFRRSPDLGRTRFVSPIDLIANNAYPLDREGHGTFVASEVAESTNNGIGLAGLAYGAAIMPVRVLNAGGAGDAGTIAHGIRYATNHGAAVINLSLEFSLDIAAADIPEIQAALRYAHNRGVVVVGASGNEGTAQIAYPARFPTVISVGATTIDRCLADYSNTGPRLDLVAPGGGQDSGLIADPACRPGRSLPDIFQMTLYDGSDPRRFGLPGGWFGTSMSAPMVSAVAALVIASGVIGRHPSPDAVLTQLERTAKPLGRATPNPNYGYGLIDAGAATASAASVPVNRTG
jgi:serine protease